MAIALLFTLIPILGAIVFYLACAWCTRQFFTHPETGENPLEEGISVLVPICGVDAGAWENWTSLCKQDYPNYEVLFGVVDSQDPAIPLLQKLAATFPKQVRLFIGLEPRGINHKDSTLSYLLEEMQHEVIVFVDSDIRVSPDYLKTITAPLHDLEIGMVTCAFVGHHPTSITSALASLSRCCEFIPSALIAQALDGGLRFAVGATIAMRKSALEKAGGLHLNRIGSDYNLGKRTALAGYQIKLSRYILESDTGSESFRELFQRELRWARTIRFNRGPIYYTMIFCYGVVFCLPLLVLSGFAQWAIALSLFTLTIRYIQALIAINCLNCPKLLPWLGLLPLRDILSLTVWAIGSFGSRVYWRGRKLRITGDGLIMDNGQLTINN